MQNKILRTWCVSLLLVMFTISLFTSVVSGDDGTTYYVAPGGDDDNPGTKDQPWQTIGKAAATLVSGDTVYIRAGTYQERIVPQDRRHR